MRIPLYFLVLIAGPAISAQIVSMSRLQQPPQPTGKGVIEGTVVNAITQEPVKKAQVMLEGNASLSAATDAAGHFLFRDLPAGSFTVQANASGYEGRGPLVMRGNGGGHFQQVKLEAEEKVSGVTISLTPNSSLSGRVLDEDGGPMPQCQTTLMQYEEQQGSRNLQQRNGAQSDENGDYRFTNVLPGKYYVLAHCFESRTLPHAFVERGPDVDVPAESYAPVFYPGASDLAGAMRVTVAPGVDTGGINFRMKPVLGVTVRAHLSRPPSNAIPENIQIILHVRDPQLRQAIQYGPQVQQSEKYQFSHVPPGSYELEAFTMSGDSTENQAVFYAKMQVEVAPHMDPIEFALTRVPTITGTLTVEKDETNPSTFEMENVQINLNSMEQQFGWMQPQSKIQKDGTFTVTGVIPGKWRLFTGGIPAYVKSITWNDEQISGTDLEVGASGGKLNIVLSTKWATLDGTVTGDASPGETVNALVWPDEPSLGQMGNRIAGIDPNRHFQMGNMAPGKYHGCAIAEAQPWTLLQNDSAKKKLEGRCAAFELTEAGQSTVQLPIISSADLDTLSREQ